MSGEQPVKSSGGFISFMKTACEKSMVTGIPEIFAARYIPLKIIRFVVFTLCILGFGYQSLEFMNLYWEYSTVLDIQISKPLEAEMPAMTVCDINGILRSKYCQYHSCDVPENEVDFCGCFKTYCEFGQLLPGILIRTSVQEFENVSLLPQQEREKYMIPASEFILSCKISHTDSDKVTDCGKPVLNPSGSSTSTEPTVCYNIHSFHKRPNEKMMTIPTSTVIDLVLFMKPEEYDFWLVEMQKQISIHSPYQMSNPFADGHYLAGGKQYKLFVKETVKNLMEPPYDTNCFDYLEAWKERNGEGPVSELDCLEHCKLEKYKEGDLCVPYILWYPHNYRRCVLNCPPEFCEVYGSFAENLIEFTRQCGFDCKPACRQVSYEIVKEEVPSIGEVRRGETLTKIDGHVFVRISYEKYERTVYTYTPKYEVIETFSYIGGYVGIWLGISLVAVFDFLETLLVILKYPFGKKKQLAMLKQEV